MDKQQQVLEMAKDICRYQPCCNDVCKPISACDALRYAERAVEAGYSKQGWISVDERLPKERERVLVVCEDGIVRLNMVKHGYFPEITNIDCISVKTTHWMPLPEAPKDGDKDVKGTPNKTYYTPDEVRNMSMNEIRDNITAIRKSMKRWRDE